MFYILKRKENYVKIIKYLINSLEMNRHGHFFTYTTAAYDDGIANGSGFSFEKEKHRS